MYCIETKASRLLRPLAAGVLLLNACTGLLRVRHTHSNINVRVAIRALPAVAKSAVHGQAPMQDANLLVDRLLAQQRFAMLHMHQRPQIAATCDCFSNG
jgi:hypothetical protein